MAIKAISPIPSPNQVILHGVINTMQRKIDNLNILVENKDREIKELRKILVHQHLNSKIVFCANCAKELNL